MLSWRPDRVAVHCSDSRDAPVPARRRMGSAASAVGQSTEGAGWGSSSAFSSASSPVRALAVGGTASSPAAHGSPRRGGRGSCCSRRRTGRRTLSAAKAQLEAKEEAVRLARSEIDREVTSARPSRSAHAGAAGRAAGRARPPADRARAARAGRRRSRDTRAAAPGGAEGGEGLGVSRELERISGMTIERGEGGGARPVGGARPARARPARPAARGGGTVRRRGGGRATSSPTPCSGSPPATPRRRPSRSSSSPPTT